MKKSTVALTLALALAIPLAVGGLGAWATAGALNDWYPALQKPGWNPPDWIFGPVWTILYLMMGYASWRIVRLGWESSAVRKALAVYTAQLVFNLGWSFLFFGFQRPDLALVEILFLLLLVLVTLMYFIRLDRIAGWLLVPYLGWTFFATSLNASIWWLNR